MTDKQIKDLTEQELRQLIKQAVRESLAELRRDAAPERDGLDWEAAVDLTLQKFDQAWRRLADL